MVAALDLRWMASSAMFYRNFVVSAFSFARRVLKTGCITGRDTFDDRLVSCSYSVYNLAMRHQ